FSAWRGSASSGTPLSTTSQRRRARLGCVLCGRRQRQKARSDARSEIFFRLPSQMARDPNWGREQSGQRCLITLNQRGDIRLPRIVATVPKPRQPRRLLHGEGADVRLLGNPSLTQMLSFHGENVSDPKDIGFAAQEYGA